MRRSFVPVLLLAASAAGFAPAPALAALQKSCKPPVTAAGTHKALPLARKIAKQGWGQQVAASHGAAWAKLGNATVLQNGCEHGVQGWTCVFVAKPCRPNGPRLSPHAPGTGPALRWRS